MPQSLSGSPFESLQTFVECGSVSARSLPTGPCLDSALDDLCALSCGFSHTRFWGEVSFSFVPVSVAKTQGSSSLAPRPYQRENIHDGRLLYPVRAPMFSLVCSAPHRLRCERLFVSAGCSAKKILKTSVSFWLRMSI